MVGLIPERIATILGMNDWVCGAGWEGGARGGQAGGGPARPTQGGQRAAREQRSGSQMSRHLCGLEDQPGRSHSSGGIAHTCRGRRGRISSPDRWRSLGLCQVPGQPDLVGAGSLPQLPRCAYSTAFVAWHSPLQGEGCPISVSKWMFRMRAAGAIVDQTAKQA